MSDIRNERAAAVARDWVNVCGQVEQLQAENEYLNKRMVLVKTNRNELFDKSIELRTKLAAANITLAQIYDCTSEGFIIEAIDVLRGRAVWNEDGLAQYPGKGGKQ